MGDEVWTRSASIRITDGLKDSFKPIPTGDYVLVLRTGKCASHAPIRQAQFKVSVCTVEKKPRELFSVKTKLMLRRPQRRFTFVVPPGEEAKLEVSVSSKVVAKPIVASVTLLRAGDANESYIHSLAISTDREVDDDDTLSSSSTLDDDEEEDDDDDCVVPAKEFDRTASGLGQLCDLLIDVKSLSSYKRNLVEAVCGPWPNLHTSDVLSFDITQCVREMERDSKYKRDAFDAGLIRPFLALVALHPLLRLGYAKTLKVDIMGTSSYGDAHHEAWMLLVTNRYGMQARANHAITDTINPIGDNCNWYQILHRVCRETFKASKKTEKDTKKDIKDARHSHSSSMPFCKTPRSEEMLKLEDVFLRAYVETQKFVKGGHKENEEERAEWDSVVRFAESDERAIRAAERLIANGYTDEEACKLAAGLLVDGMEGSDRTSWFQAKKDTKRDAIGMAKMAIPVAGAVFCIAVLPMAPIIPAAMLAINTAAFVFRETPRRLLGPLTGVMLSRIILAVHGVSFDDYYPDVASPSSTE